MIQKNTFIGTSGLFTYLSPSSMGYYPLVQLPDELNPFKKDGITLYVKIMSAHPLLSIKALPAWYLVKSAAAATKHLVEYSSGNTAAAMAVFAKHAGKAMHAVIAPDVPQDKQKFLSLAGVRVLVYPGAQSPQVVPATGGIKKALELGAKTNWECLNQYTHKAVLEASKKNIGKQLCKQLPSLSVFCAALGTSGTLVGASSALTKKYKDIKIVGCSIAEGSSIPGPRNTKALPFLGFDWKQYVSSIEEVKRKPAFDAARKLNEWGIMAGPSTGMQYAGVLNYLKKCKKDGSITHIAKQGGNVVFLVCDTPLVYMNEF